MRSDFFVLLSLENFKEALLLVVDDHDALVNAHAGLGRHGERVGSHREVDADDSGVIGLVAGTALIGEDAVLLAVEDSLDDVVDTTKVDGLDLDHIHALVVDPALDIFVGVGILVDDELHRGALLVELLADVLEAFHLLGVGLEVDGHFAEDLVGLADLFHLDEVIDDLIEIVVEAVADGAVHIVTHDGVVIGLADLLDSLGDPVDPVEEDFAVAGAELLLDVVDQTVRHHADLLEDHLIDVDVTLIAGLRVQTNRSEVDGEVVLIENDLAHGAVLDLGNTLEDGLGDAVTDGSGQTANFGELVAVERLGGLLEVGQIHALEVRNNVLVDDFDQLSTGVGDFTAIAGSVLGNSAVTVGDVAVLENEHNGDGNAGLTDVLEAGGDRLALVNKTVFLSAALDGFLVVHVEAGQDFSAKHFFDFHKSPPRIISFKVNNFRYQHAMEYS